MSEKCSYCGEEGHSIQNCPKWKGKIATASERKTKIPPAEATREALGNVIESFIKDGWFYLSLSYDPQKMVYYVQPTVAVAIRPITMEHLDYLRSFEIDVDFDEWLRLYLEASKSLGKVLGEPTATHLWAKFRDMGLLRMWALLDKDNREIVIAMLKMWKR